MSNAAGKGGAEQVRKPAFLQREPLTRLGVAFLLTAGVTLPFLLALGLDGYAVPCLLGALGALAVFTALSGTRKTRILLGVLLGLAAAFQFFLPGAGLLGDCVEAFKALALYFSGYTTVLPLFGAQVAGLITALTVGLSFLFSKRGEGFLPAAMIVVLTLFGIWSLGKGDLFWYASPALVALLLLMAQSAHEKINLLHVLPMALAAVLLAFLLVPSGTVTVEPLAQAAGDLKQKISDYLFFTEARDVFTLGSYGYYPMGNNQLGGEAEPTEFPVMMVKTDRKTLMRAVVKDYYDGRSFSDTSSAKRYLYVNPRWQKQRQKAFLELLPSDALRKTTSLLAEKAITVQMQNSAASTVLTPLFLRSLAMTGDMVPYFNDSSELFITRDLALGDRYTVYTPVFEGGDSGLDAVVNATLKNDEYYQDILDTYTQLPGHMEQKVFNDVADIVSAETTPYGKAMAIMRHLQKYYRYTLSPDTPPLNQDFVTYFLYVGKEGYCTYYAAAMTVMCRMAGLPARYVEGFLAQPASDGFAYVTGKDAHAWTEVYFEGFGWVPFDPTPLQQSDSDIPAQAQTSPSPSPSASPSPSPSPDGEPTPSPAPDQQQQQEENTPQPQPSEEPEDQNDDTPDTSPYDEENNEFPWLWALLAAVLAGLAVRILLRMPDRVAARRTTEKDKIFVYGSAVQKLLAYAKRKPGKGETPLAFARRVDGVHAFPSPIMPLWRILVLSNYSRTEPGAAQTQRARDTFRMVYGHSRLFGRFRFLLAAAFDPRLYRALDTPAPHDKPVEKLAFKPPAPSAKEEAEARAAARREAKAQGKKKAAGKPAGRPAGKPAGKPARKPGGKARGKADGRNGSKPEDGPKPVAKPAKGKPRTSKPPGNGRKRPPTA